MLATTIHNLRYFGGDTAVKMFITLKQNEKNERTFLSSMCMRYWTLLLDK